MITYNQQNGAVTLNSPISMPNACGFLWNKNMMIQMNCRGYAVAQFMQPEPAKYAHGPALEAKTFMQPEHAYFSHHPGRFFYIKDNHTGEFFSLPYAPVKQMPTSFEFIAAKNKISWKIAHLNLTCELSLSLTTNDTAELWQLSIINHDETARDLSIYSYFPVGYMSWMNQSARFDNELNAILCESVTPYQKVDQYFTQQNFKDCTVFLSDRKPVSYETRQSIFEGEGGLNNPDAIKKPKLASQPAHYQTPAAIMQFDLNLAPSESSETNFVFAPVKDAKEAATLKQKYLASPQTLANAKQDYQQYIAQADNQLQIETGTQAFDNFVNHWLPRQVFYHGDVNRLSTDPQTRNYLQDAMGMMYIAPDKTKAAFIKALSQQHDNGEMPDGILLNADSELKYINQIPHTDHCVWLVICIEAYLNETGDYEFLEQMVPFAPAKTAATENAQSATVYEHINLALDFLWSQRDDRGLNYINQGDWCDPMNMVGYKGIGVSSWLSLASAYSMKLWAQVNESISNKAQNEKWLHQADKLNQDVNEHCWDGEWFARGITDAGNCFGVSKDIEGRIYLNPQSFSMLSGAISDNQWQSMQYQIKQQLKTPFGMMMLAPSYTHMHEEVGRLTQKFPGTAENGSVYNHAGAFYIYALFEHEETEAAFELLHTMICAQSDEDALARGQLPVFIPNYYRGAYFQYPDDAGKSSQLFNTGTVAWIYRIVIEQLVGLKGVKDGLKIQPQLPKTWNNISVKRQFRQASIKLDVLRSRDIDEQQVYVDDKQLIKNSRNEFVLPVKANSEYCIKVLLP
ncbi:GH36-type glycosyl hydrolase domain-containing protein [Shewanella sp. TC10]|uniref:GH36-type glycosyl hydrolase domain-containing protein n=1 Tax=Shewanella sp. TC10 TaxID=1419739 RepID=UPI001E497A17|nr:NdvB protein [Shewanella sp. TC10]